MDNSLLLLVLIVLTFATALNLFLTLRLAAVVRAGSNFPEAHLSLPLGEVVPPFEGQWRLDGSRIASADLLGQAVVLVFLSPGCRACKGKIAELLQILAGVRNAGIALCIVPADDVHDITKLLGEAPLLDHVLLMDAATRRRLNPRNAAPFYIFIDDQMIAKGSNYIGDEDWQSFVQQMTDLASGDSPQNEQA